MADWHDVGPIETFTEASHICVEAAGESLVVFCMGGQWSAMRNVCPHAGKPLGDGEVRGRVMVCPYHGFAYDIATGRNADFPYDEPPCRMLSITTQNGRVYVDVEH